MRLLVCLTVMVSIGAGVSAQSAGAPAAPAMTLTVSGFADGGQIPVRFSQAAPGVAVWEGTSPAMKWATVPAGTRSFFLHDAEGKIVRFFQGAQEESTLRAALQKAGVAK